jgi:hypothetical protein
MLCKTWWRLGSTPRQLRSRHPGKVMRGSCRRSERPPELGPNGERAAVQIASWRERTVGSRNSPMQRPGAGCAFTRRTAVRTSLVKTRERVAVLLRRRKVSRVQIPEHRWRCQRLWLFLEISTMRDDSRLRRFSRDLAGSRPTANPGRPLIINGSVISRLAFISGLRLYLPGQSRQWCLVCGRHQLLDEGAIHSPHSPR